VRLISGAVRKMARSKKARGPEMIGALGMNDECTWDKKSMWVATGMRRAAAAGVRTTATAAMRTAAAAAAL
jgi:hypothetical protein